MGDSNGVKTISVAKALFQKYEECDDGLLPNVCLSSKKAATGHSPSYANRTIISLDNYGINSAGEVEEIVKLCPRLEELDLSKNDITEWKEIFRIVSQLPHLKHLNLSSNPLVEIPDVSELCETFSQDSLVSLEHIILNSTELHLETVYKLLGCFTGIKELHISLNDYTTVPPCEQTFHSVRWISFNKNALSNWSDVEQLGNIFPNLEVLMLSENPIESISIEGSTSSLANLTTLSVTKSWISDWNSIDALRKLPLLKDVRLLGIPLAEDLADNLRRQLLIARIPHVTRLNGTLIEGAEEKADAERAFIRHHMDDENKTSRYQELVDIHGIVTRLANVDLGPQYYVTVEIQFESEPSVLKKINTKLTVQQLKNELRNLTGGLPTSKFFLMYKEYGYVHWVLMRYPSKVVYSYRMRDGDQIFIGKNN